MVLLFVKVVFGAVQRTGELVLLKALYRDTGYLKSGPLADSCFLGTQPQARIYVPTNTGKPKKITI